MKTLLTIAGFDPSSGAGITADLAVFAAHGAHGLSAITALTVQSTLGVRSVEAADATQLSDSLECLVDDIVPAGIKIGMLANAANVAAVANFIGGLRDTSWDGRVVLDPVLRSSSDRELLDPEAIGMVRHLLLPLVDWTTPNRAELAALAQRGIASEAEVEQACRHLQAYYPALNLAATGGDGDASDFVLTSSGAGQWLRAERLSSRATHGTGCAFSSALLCGLSDGLPGPAAAGAAKKYVRQAIRTAKPLGRGKGPLNLLWPLRQTL